MFQVDVFWAVTPWILLASFTLMKEAASFSETSASCSYTAHYHNPEDLDLDLHRHGDLKSCILLPDMFL
jgi:hypothetical protein